MAARAIAQTSGPDDPLFHTTRRRGIGGSEAAVAAGLDDQYDSRWTLWRSKRGDIPPDPDTEAAYWGRALEPVIAARYSEAHPERMILNPRRIYAHPDHPWALASVDRLTLIA
ncbi:MAG: YqaJ viral recombinase family protein, partial [Acidimicrobiales bacterium]